MPYTAKQHRLFEAAAHDPSVAKKVKIPQGTAKKLASANRFDNYGIFDRLRKCRCKYLYCQRLYSRT